MRKRTPSTQEGVRFSFEPRGRSSRPSQKDSLYQSISTEIEQLLPCFPFKKSMNLNGISYNNKICKVIP